MLGANDACSRGEKGKRKEDEEEEKEGTIGDHKILGIHAHHFLCAKITVTLFRAEQLLALRVYRYCFQANIK